MTDTNLVRGNATTPRLDDYVRALLTKDMAAISAIFTNTSSLLENSLTQLKAIAAQVAADAANAAEAATGAAQAAGTSKVSGIFGQTTGQIEGQSLIAGPSKDSAGTLRPEFGYGTSNTDASKLTWAELATYQDVEDAQTTAANNLSTEQSTRAAAVATLTSAVNDKVSSTQYMGPNDYAITGLHWDTAGECPIAVYSDGTTTYYPNLALATDVQTVANNLSTEQSTRANAVTQLNTAVSGKLDNYNPNVSGSGYQPGTSLVWDGNYAFFLHNGSSTGVELADVGMVQTVSSNLATEQNTRANAIASLENEKVNRGGDNMTGALSVTDTTSTTQNTLDLKTPSTAAGEQSQLGQWGTFVGSSDIKTRLISVWASYFNGGTWGTETTALYLSNGTPNDDRSLSNMTKVIEANSSSVTFSGNLYFSGGSETVASTSDVATVASNLATEQSTRSAAVATLATELSTEQSTRASADSALQNQLNNMVSGTLGMGPSDGKGLGIHVAYDSSGNRSNPSLWWNKPDGSGSANDGLAWTSDVQTVASNLATEQSTRANAISSLQAAVNTKVSGVGDSSQGDLTVYTLAYRPSSGVCYVNYPGGNQSLAPLDRLDNEISARENTTAQQMAFLYGYGPGVYNVTSPSWARKFSFVAIGGGGGGGGCYPGSDWATTSSSGAGGGSGGFATGTININPGDVLYIGVGSGGAGSSGPNTAGTGGEVHLGNNTDGGHVYFICEGGQGGQWVSELSAAGGAGGGVSNIDTSQNIFTMPGGSGGDGQCGSMWLSGNGAASYFGSGGRAGNTGGMSSGVYGAGGGGAYCQSSGVYNGGNGGPALILIRFWP